MGFFDQPGWASFSECKRYRYALGRTWDSNRPRICFIMLNPSTASETKDDNTIRKITAFAKKWGYGGLFVVNLFGLRATNPKMLYVESNPIGQGNDEAIETAVFACKAVVVAWGQHGKHMDRAAYVCKMLRKFKVKPLCLRVAKNGMPYHPLYIPLDTPLQPYAGYKGL